MQDDFVSSFSSGEENPAQRIQRPHIGWAALFAGIYFALQLVLGVAIAWKFGAGGLSHAKSDPRVAFALVMASIASAVLTILLGWPVMRVFWGRPFWNVIHWNWSHVRGRVIQFIALGIGMSIVAQLLERLMTLPNDMPIDAFFHSRALLWCLTLYGTIVAPIFEETMFRGFLLPAIAVAVDWMLPQRERPRYETDLSVPAVITSSILTSAGFGMMHAQQLGFAWNAVALLSCVGLVLAFVRLHFRSVAASAVVHSAYNSSLFILMFIATGGYRHLDKLTQR